MRRGQVPNEVDDPESYRDRFKELNDVDVRLYSWVRARFEQVMQSAVGS
jgi:hypothetical protein